MKNINSAISQRINFHFENISDYLKRVLWWWLWLHLAVNKVNRFQPNLLIMPFLFTRGADFLVVWNRRIRLVVWYSLFLLVWVYSPADPVLWSHYADCASVRARYLWLDNTFAVWAGICLHTLTKQKPFHSLRQHARPHIIQIKAILITECYRDCCWRVRWHFLITLSTSSKGDQSLILDWWQKVGGRRRWPVCSGAPLHTRSVSN